MIRRRKQVQLGTTRTFGFTCILETNQLGVYVGRTLADAVNPAEYSVYDPDGVLILGPLNPTIDNTAVAYSHIWQQIFLDPNDFDIGTNYRIEFDWRPAGAPMDNERYTKIIYFDIVRKEWQCEVDLTSLEGLMPSIGFKLERQAAQRSIVQTLERRTEEVISDAQDMFFLWLAKKVREDQLRSYVNLVPDSNMFDIVVAHLGVALTHRADIKTPNDQNDYKFQLWRDAAKELFGQMTLVEYDTNQDGLPDDTAINPFATKATFESM